MFNRKLRRSGVLRFFEKLPACLVGMEARGSAHYWARETLSVMRSGSFRRLMSNPSSSVARRMRRKLRPSAKRDPKDHALRAD